MAARTDLWSHKALAFVAPLPEAAFAAVFPVGAPCDRLDEAAHQPGQAAQTLSQHLKTLRVAQDALAFDFDRFLGIFASREQAHPARGNLVVAPALCTGGIDMHNEVEMVAHHRIGVDRNGEAFRDQLNPRFDPLLSMLEGLSGIAIHAAKKGPAHAALYAMVGAGRLWGRDVAAGRCHAPSMRYGLSGQRQENPQ